MLAGTIATLEEGRWIDEEVRKVSGGCIDRDGVLVATTDATPVGDLYEGSAFGEGKVVQPARDAAGQRGNLVGKGG